MKSLAAYRELSKSGIVGLVLISVLGGYLAGQPLEKPFDLPRLLLTLFGVLFLASGSSALNQLQERRIDSQMARTRGRPIPSGKISPAQALAFVVFSLVLGGYLLFRIQRDILLLGLAAVLSYNVLYTLWWKRRWAFAAVPGAVPGALPILMGYAAACGKVFAPGGLYLFFILFFWQMPHFWVLALKYRADYEQGGFPTLPVAKGSGVTVLQITLWCLAYVAIGLGAPLFLPVSKIYLAVSLLTGIQLLRVLRGFVKAPESKQWLRFFLWINFSLIIYIGAAVADLWSVYLDFWTKR